MGIGRRSGRTESPFTVMNGTDNYLAKGWDDRVGCGV